MDRYRMVLVLSVLMLMSSAFADDLSQRVRTDWRVLQDVQRDFLARSADLSAIDRGEYRTYIEHLRQRVANGCEALRADGVAPPADVVCPQTRVPAGPAAIDQRGEQTRSEATATLDAELDAGLGDFDQRLLREQERIKAAAPRSASGADGGGVAGNAGEGGGADAAPPSAPTPGAERPAGTAAPAGGQPSPGGPVPADIPDGADDDVVARQIREAAQQETDPQLREKLWDEYRKYKQGSR